MTTEKTYEHILDRMLAHVKNSDPSLDTREGSVMFLALAPAALALAQGYADLEASLDECFPDTASRDALIRLADVRGLVPREPTAAVWEAEFDAAVPLETRFTCGGVEYFVSSARQVTCAEPGVSGLGGGTLLPQEELPGLTVAKLVRCIQPACAAESIEEFRARVCDAFRDPPFGGNIADYKRLVSALPGVGAARILPTYTNWGYVGVVLIGRDINDDLQNQNAPLLVEAVKDILDPKTEEGLGKGLAPIGHIVKVLYAEKVLLSLRPTVKCAGSVDTMEVEAKMKKICEDFFADCRRVWGDEAAFNRLFRPRELAFRLYALDEIDEIDALDWGFPSLDKTKLEKTEIPYIGTFAPSFDAS